MQDVAIAKVLKQEARRGEEVESHRIEPNSKDDTSRWIRLMQWKESFHGKDLMVRKMDLGGIADDYLVDWLHSSFSSQEPRSSGSHENQ